MSNNLVRILGLGFFVMSAAGRGQVRPFVPVSKELLANPNADDWLMYSNT